MLRGLPKSVPSSVFTGTRVRRPSLIVAAAFLTKLAKHLALLACLMTVGQATGRTAIGPLVIFLLVILATSLYSIGRALRRRFPVLIGLSEDRR